MQLEYLLQPHTTRPSQFNWRLVFGCRNKLLIKKNKIMITIGVNTTESFCLDDIEDQITDNELLELCRERQLLRPSNQEVKEMDGEELKHLLCDITEVSYHCQIDEVLTNLKQKL